MLVIVAFALAAGILLGALAGNAQRAAAQERRPVEKPNPTFDVTPGGWLHGQAGAGESWIRPDYIALIQIDPSALGAEMKKRPVVFIEKMNGSRYRVDCPTFERAQELARELLVHLGGLPPDPPLE